MTRGCVGSDHGWVSQCNHPRRCSATIWRTIAAYHCSHLSFDVIITLNFVIFLILIDSTIHISDEALNSFPKYNLFVIDLVVIR